MSGWGWLSGLQSHKTGTVLTSPLFTEWSVQPRGCWLENNKCCYWWLGPKQDIANACPSLSNYCSLWAPDSDKPIATPSIHWSIYPAILFALLLNWEKKNTRRKYKRICCNDDRHSACLLWVSSSGSRNRTLWLDTALMQLCILPTHPTTPGHCSAMPWVKCADSCMLMLEPNLLYFISYTGRRTEAKEGGSFHQFHLSCLGE